MSQASRYVETRRMPVDQLPADVFEAVRGATTIPIEGEAHRGARFADGSTAWNSNGRWIVTDELGTRDMTDAGK